MRVVHLIRHGATLRNNDNLALDTIRGWDNVQLSKQGRMEAYKLADRIASNKPAVLLSSDLIRASSTARIIAHENKIWLRKPTREFRPWNVGEFTGKSSAEVFPTLARFALRTPDEQVPGGESFDSFRNRFLNGLARALRSYEGEIGIVAHHRNERFLLAWARAGFPWDGSFDEEEFMQRGSATGSLSLVQIPVYEKLAAVLPPSDYYDRVALVTEHLKRRET